MFMPQLMIVVTFATSVSSDEIGNGKPATLSTFYGTSWEVDHINDGLTSTCTHTQHELTPFVYIDLEGTYSIDRVKITNRAGCCQDRLLGGVVRIGTSADDVTANTPCGEPVTSEEIQASLIVERECDPTVFARFVSVSIENGINDPINLCEIEVFGNVKLVQYNDHCYKIFNTGKSWSEAKAECESQSSYMWTINTEDEKTHLLDHMASFTTLHHTWTGLNDKRVEGTPTWLTHESSVYANFDISEGNSDEMDCFQIIIADGLLRQEYCQNINGYICEARLIKYKTYSNTAIGKRPSAAYVIRRLSAISSGACSLECMNLIDCRSFSFNIYTHECQLSTGTGESGELEEVNDFNVFVLETSDPQCGFKLT